MIFEGKEVEVFELNGQVLFNSKHVAECLGIKNVNDNIRSMNEKQAIKLRNSDIGNSDIRKLNNAGENLLTERTDFMNEITIVEYQNQRVLTTNQLAEVYGTSTDNIKKNFSNNKERFVEGKHYYCLEGKNLKEFKNRVNDIHLVGKNANTLYLWTEQGASRHCKILDTDRAWQQFDVLEETYFKAKEVVPQLNNLSPQLQLLINMEIEQSKMKEQIHQVKSEVKGIRDVVAINLTDWRKATTNVINSIAKLQDGNFQNVRAESYKLLEQRARCDLKARRRNMKLRGLENGMSQSKADKINYLDVIENDSRLTEIYISIIKEMAIKNGVDFEGGVA